MATGNTHTRFITRSSTTFVAPEISIQEELLKFERIEELEKIDFWVLLMTLFFAIKVDQAHPFELNISKSNKDSTGKVFVTSAEHQVMGSYLARNFHCF